MSDVCVFFLIISHVYGFSLYSSHSKLSELLFCVVCSKFCNQSHFVSVSSYMYLRSLCLFLSFPFVGFVRHIDVATLSLYILSELCAHAHALHRPSRKI